MSPERAQAAWEAQASAVAKRLGLNDEQTKELARAYVDARKSHNEAMSKAREEAMNRVREQQQGDNPPEQGRRGNAGEMARILEEVNTKEREKFANAIPGSLSGGQRDGVLASLGSFNRQWDGLTSAIVGLKLEADKQQSAMEAAEEYLAAAGNQRRNRGEPPADEQAARQAREKARAEMEAARTKFVDKLKGILTEEQMKTIEPAIRGGGRGGQGGAPGGQPGGAPGEGERPRRGQRPGGGGGGGGDCGGGDR